MFQYGVLLLSTDPKGFYVFPSEVTEVRTFVIGYGLLKSGYHTLICIREVLSSIRVSRVAIMTEILTHFFNLKSLLEN